MNMSVLDQISSFQPAVFKKTNFYMMKTISYTYSAKWKHGYIVPLFSVSYYCKKVPIASVPLIILLCFVCSSFFVCCLICVHRAGWEGSPTVPVLNEMITLM